MQPEKREKQPGCGGHVAGVDCKKNAQQILLRLVLFGGLSEDSSPGRSVSEGSEGLL